MKTHKVNDFIRLKTDTLFPAPKSVYFSKDLTLKAGALGQIEYIFEYAAPELCLCRFEDELKRPLWLEIELNNIIGVETSKRKNDKGNYQTQKAEIC